MTPPHRRGPPGIFPSIIIKVQHIHMIRKAAGIKPAAFLMHDIGCIRQEPTWRAASSNWLLYSLA